MSDEDGVRGLLLGPERGPGGRVEWDGKVEESHLDGRSP